MHPSRYSLLAAAFLGLAPAAPSAAQETAPAAPAEPAAPAAETAPAAPSDPAPGAPAEPGAAAPEAAAPETPAPEAPESQPAAPEPVAPGAEVPAAPPQPEITVTEHGDWEVGCVAGTSNCEMQQVAMDPEGNPVVLVRVVKLPEGEDAEALAIFNTPLGTLLPAGLGFQIDAGEAAALPFEWCVQEGCIVRLGLREPDVTALKRGRAVALRVASIAAPEQPLELSLSLMGFTAAYDSLGVPAAAPAAQQ